MASEVSVVDLNIVQGVAIYLSNNNFMHNYASNVKIYGGNGKDYINSNVIYGTYGYVTLDGGYGDDTLVNNDPYSSLVDGAGDDSIVFNNSCKGITVNGGTGNDLDNSIVVGKKNATLNGAAGKNTLKSGDGNDLFIYDGGSDTVVDYTASKDKIFLGSAQLQDFSVEGNDVILNLGDEKSLTLLNASGKKISFVDGKKTSTNIFSENQISNDKSTAVTLSASTTNYTAQGKVVSIDGSAASGEISIVGNASNNYLITGNNGSTLTGGGSDTFIYKPGHNL